MPGLPHPSVFFSQLTDDRLAIVGSRLLDVRFNTLREMTSPYDDRYTRETAIYGRQRNMLIELARSGAHEWFAVTHVGMDVTGTLAGIPFRFFTDDPRSPQKDGFFKRNAADDLFAPDQTRPVIFRFVIEPAVSDDDDDRLFLIGFNELQEPVCEWAYRAGPTALYSVNDVAPVPAPIAPADIEIREDEERDGKGNASAG